VTTSGGTTVEFVIRQAQARWIRTRGMGRTAFVWRYGVVGWGLPCGGLSAAYHVIRARALDPALPWSAAAIRPLLGSIVGLMVVVGVVAYLFGAWLWDFCEARFAQ
jgi:hypothetical protein